MMTLFFKNDNDSGKEKFLADFQNPFENEAIEEVHIHIWKDRFLGKEKLRIGGSIEFKKGNTEGKQKFEGSSFVDLVQQMDDFIKNL